MDAAPAANFEVIHAEFLFAYAKFGFNRPASESDSQQTAKCDSVFSDNTIGKEEFQFSRANIPCRDECTACARQVLTGLPPNRQVPDLPDLRSLVSILDAILLP